MVAFDMRRNWRSHLRIGSDTKTTVVVLAHSFEADLAFAKLFPFLSNDLHFRKGSEM